MRLFDGCLAAPCFGLGQRQLAVGVCKLFCRLLWKRWYRAQFLQGLYSSIVALQPRHDAAHPLQPVTLVAGLVALLASFARLLALLDEPDAIPVLAPLIQREIHYRLLLSDQAPRLRQITAVDGQGYRIAKAIDWLKLNYALPLRVEELAARVQMSPPTFHHHFRQLTAMSPLQYQKWLRLNEAKRLMLNEHLDVSSAAFKVGYESPSQFSREYSRLFGVPPKRDMTTLRGRSQNTHTSRVAP